MKVIMVTLLLAAVALSVAEAGAYFPAPAIVPAPAAYYAAPAPALVRTPSLDSAVVHSERVGGNFAYSSVEGHAYTALTPVVHPAPVAVAYKAQPLVAPYPVVHAAPLPAVYAPAKTFYYAH
ncbi:cuticle protein 16.5-like [Rhopalosiphum padi]|uniref:cuticle protein 16.5-like n=1 Tax=Rhopalosiphum padi TaxID=40932 RepID=UPI00298E84C8|nr:cuticle protein 16.5-like [Rhopalosiphum padi]